MILKNDAERIIDASIKAALPDTAVQKALDGFDFAGKKLHIVAIGKAAWQMCSAAYSIIGDQIKDGFVVTKYNHSHGQIGKIKIFEAGHPVPDQNTYIATDAVIQAAQTWGKEDTVLFLLSGGGSALFEKPLIPEGIPCGRISGIYQNND